MAQISCIIPVFNGAPFVAEAIESVLGQTQRDVEIVVVDDGSTDATPDVLASFGNRIIVVRQENQGPGAARNAGLARATGRFVAFLDADDLWLPNKLARQLAHFAARPELEISFTALRNVVMPGFENADPPIDLNRWPVLAFSHCSLLAYREVFDRIGPFDPSLRIHEDTDWSIRMMMRGICYESLPEVLVERRIHRTNLTCSYEPSGIDLVRSFKGALDRRRREGW